MSVFTGLSRSDTTTPSPSSGRGAEARAGIAAIHGRGQPDDVAAGPGRRKPGASPPGARACRRRAGAYRDEARRAARGARLRPGGPRPMMTTTGRPRSSAAARRRAIVTLRACQASTIVGNRASGKRPQWPSRIVPAMAASRAPSAGKRDASASVRAPSDATPSRAMRRDTAGSRSSATTGSSPRAAISKSGRYMVEVRPAAGAPAQPLGELLGLHAVGERLIYRRLLVLLEHLEPDRGPAAVGHDGIEDRALVRVVRRIVVLLSEIDDVGRPGEACDLPRRHQRIVAGLHDEQPHPCSGALESRGPRPAAAPRTPPGTDRGAAKARRAALVSPSFDAQRRGPLRPRTAAKALRKRASSGLSRTASRQATSASCHRP